MNKQEIFDRVYKHMLTQNKRSINDEGSACAYRGHGGLMCAVGCLIPDELYTPQLEGCIVVKNPKVQEALVAAKVLDVVGSSDELEFLKCLQRIHDISPLHKWKSNLESLAKSRGLTLPKLP